MIYIVKVICKQKALLTLLGVVNMGGSIDAMEEEPHPAVTAKLCFSFLTKIS